MTLPTKTTTATATNAVVQTVESYIQNQNMLGEVAELDDVLYDLINKHKDNEVALKRTLQCLYQLLHNHNKWKVNFGNKLFHKLIALLIDRDGTVNRQLVANTLICVQLHARKFPRHDGKFLLSQLLTIGYNTEQPHCAQIFVQLFDDFLREMGLQFACSNELYIVIQKLIKSEIREERKSAYFIIRKQIKAIDDCEANDTTLKEVRFIQNWDTSKHYTHMWSCYVTIMENLEEQQSHLVLPTLNRLMPQLRNAPLSFKDWENILYIKLLRDNNILVVRWTLEHLLVRFTPVDLLFRELLNEFLTATNKTQLFNPEAYSLPYATAEFLSPGNVVIILDAIGDIEWRSVPLLYWLNCITSATCVQKIPICLLLRLSGRVRKLPNMKLRQHAIRHVVTLLKRTIDDLTLAEYLKFLQTLLNTSDVYEDIECLKCKIVDSNNGLMDIANLTQRCYELIVPYNRWLKANDHRYVTRIIDQLLLIPVAQHGWWRFLLTFELAQFDLPLWRSFMENQYKLDVNLLEQCSSIKTLQQHLLETLQCLSKAEKSCVREKCVDMFVAYHLKEWSDLDRYALEPLELLDMGSQLTFEMLADRLSNVRVRLENEKVLAAFKVLLKKHYKSKRIFKVIENIFIYARANLQQHEVEALATDIIAIDANDLNLVGTTLQSASGAIPIELCIRGLLHGETATGDARIEAAYHNILECDASADDVVLRSKYLEAHMSDAYKTQLIERLLELNNSLSAKKSRYFENSKEHRLKMRIAKSLLCLTYDFAYSSAELWTAALQSNDQLNVSFMYECLAARHVTGIPALYDQLHLLDKLKPSQQTSLLSIAYIYSMLNLNAFQSNECEKLITYLLPLTMGANFQTRLFAQLVIHTLLSKWKLNGLEIPIGATLLATIEQTLGAKFAAYAKDEVRLMLPELFNTCEPKYYDANAALPNFILYMTNAPFDEFCKYSVIHLEETLQQTLDDTRRRFQAKGKLEDAPIVELKLDNSNVQRKMNPTCDICPKNDLLATDSVPDIDHQIIVVASLIDKLPNLGGLARTCEVLGVETLVLSCKADVDKSDFQNLSMTAEKSLNIFEVKPTALVEFLLEKQIDGYKLVGAEQTADSLSFSNFKFPKKCVLLLGHEKHGIPVDLIGLLDYAVEVPQFGMVRSLNVHVTGSLFIWEYCKQHMIEK